MSLRTEVARLVAEASPGPCRAHVYDLVHPCPNCTPKQSRANARMNRIGKLAKKIVVVLEAAQDKLGTSSCSPHCTPDTCLRTSLAALLREIAEVLGIEATP